MKRFIQTPDRAESDAFFMADHLVVLVMPMSALNRSDTATSLEPFTLLSTLSMVAERTGRVATATTDEEPCHVALRLACLDRIGACCDVGGGAWSLHRWSVRTAQTVGRFARHPHQPPGLSRRETPDAMIAWSTTSAPTSAEEDRP